MNDIDWNKPPRVRTLPPGEVHVWRASLHRPQAELDEFWATLSADERARVERFYLEKHRRRFLAARGLLRALLAPYLQRAPESLAFRYGAHGKPSLIDEDLLFNLAHSEEGMLLGVTRVGEVGVDLEYLRPLVECETLARRFFAPREVNDLARVAAERKVEAFFHCWTRKEAYLKACGDGLSRPLHQFAVSLLPGEPAQLLHVTDHPQETRRWRFRELFPWPDYVGCLALAAHDWRLTCWDADVS